MKRMTVVSLVTTVAFITWVLIAAAYAEGGLKVIVKLKYSDWIKEHGMGKAYFRYYDDGLDVSKTKDLSKNFPKQVTIKFPTGAVDVGEGFFVILNSYKCDDASQTEGTNGPGKNPEIVKLRFPC